MDDYKLKRLPIVGTALAAAIAIAACGSGSTPTASVSTHTGPGSRSTAPSHRQNSSNAALAFSKCMRSSGVPNFPDLGSNGMRIAAGSGQTISINGVALSAPAYEAAHAKCQKYMPGYTTRNLSPQAQAQQHAGALKFANCMRIHGVANYPDPKVVSSSAGNQTVYLAGIHPHAPAFQAAAKACGGFDPKR